MKQVNSKSYKLTTLGKRVSNHKEIYHTLILLADGVEK